MATNPMDYCPADDTRSCENCEHFSEWSEYGQIFHDCLNLDSPMQWQDDVDPSIAEECSLYKEVTRGN